jgi:hypothetical protein
MDWSDSDLTDTLLGEAQGDSNGGHGDGGMGGMNVSDAHTGGMSSSSLGMNSGAGDGGLGHSGCVDMNMDMSDWLDAIMPSTGLAPLSASVNTDPVLTPKPQDVLDLFNMEEADLYTPTDFSINLDKAIEAAGATSSNMAKF